MGSLTKNLTTFNETKGNNDRTNDTMEDSELEQIRANRMAQMGAQGGAGGSREDAAKAQEEQKKQIEDMKNSILSQCLTQEARARCDDREQPLYDGQVRPDRRETFGRRLQGAAGQSECGHLPAETQEHSDLQ